MLKRFSILAASILVSLCQNEARACASCGSGGDDPLILYPNDDVRIYLALSRATDFKTVDINGTEGTDAGPQFKDALTFAIGKSISPETFVTVTLPYLQNLKNGDSKKAIGDPIFAFRHSVLMQNIEALYLPQIQLALAYKYAHARAIQDAESPALLDVFGTGVSETKLGIDVFWGMSDLKGGFAHSFYLPSDRQFESIHVEPGIGQRSTLTLGYGIDGLGKTVFGINRETRGERRDDGKIIPRSSETNHSAFISVDATLTSLDMIRLTISKRAALLENKNTSRANSVTLAYLRSL